MGQASLRVAARIGSPNVRLPSKPRRIIMPSAYERFRPGPAAVLACRQREAGEGRGAAREGLGSFRVRFVEEGGRVIKLVGLYSDGREDESPRDS